MKTYNQSNTYNALTAKKQHKTLRNLRKRNGNTSLYEQSGEAKNTTHIEDELDDDADSGKSEDGYNSEEDFNYEEHTLDFLKSYI